MLNPSFGSLLRFSSVLRRLGTVLAMCVLAGHGLAQRQFDELQRSGWPGDALLARAMASGDVDGDGDVDLVVGRGRPVASPVQLLLNDGTGSFTDVSASQCPAYTGVVRLPMCMQLADLDGDGDLDLLVALHWVGETWCYLNDGTGVFTDATAATGLTSGEDLVCGDVDGDGDIDVVAAPFLYLNNGSGAFTEVSSTNLGWLGSEARVVVLVDVDGDSDLDLVSGNGGISPVQNRLLLNNGSGVFVDVTATNMPALLDTTHALAAGDVDGDGDVDLVVGNAEDSNGNGVQNRLLLNQGGGVFVDGTAANMPVDVDNTSAVALADFDSDGDLDLVFGNHEMFVYVGNCQWCPDPVPEPNRLYLNDGFGGFTDATLNRLPGDPDHTTAVLVCDVTGDGHDDVVIGNTYEDRLLINNGAATFFDFGMALMGAMPGVGLEVHGDWTHSIAIGDVDGDGSPDMVLGNGRFGPGGFSRLQNSLFLNDGFGHYRQATAGRLPNDSDFTNVVAMADVDGDGDLDVITGNNQSQNRLLLNDGAGYFIDETAAQMPIDADVTHDLVVADIDGDGDVDLLFANDGTSRLYRNQGNGFFVDATASLFAVAGGAAAIACGDVDGDGDLDVALGDAGQNRLLLNNGTGLFTEVTASQLPAHLDTTTALRFADVDGDGDLDLVIANHGQTRLCLNDGAGTFSDASLSQMPVDADISSGLQLGDLDEDGDLDLVLANDGQNRLYQNDGSGTFTDATVALLPTDQDTSNGVSLADVDRDGDLDIISANFGPCRLQFNLLRQLDAPKPPRLGRTNVLDVYSRIPAQPSVDLAIVYLSTGTASIPVPGLGMIGLDLNQAVALAPAVISQPSGIASVSYTLPAMPALAGLSIYAQALVLRWSISLKLSNATADVIIP